MWTLPRPVVAVGRIDGAARKTDLTGMTAQMRGAFDEHDAVRRVGEDRHDHCRRTRRTHGSNFGAALADLRSASGIRRARRMTGAEGSRSGRNWAGRGGSRAPN